jgi:hypothetical protein
MRTSLYPTSVVTKAFTWAYQELGLNIKQASEILGISPSSLAQTTLLGFESGTREYRTQLAFIRMYHLLITMSEGDSDKMKAWFNKYDTNLETSPLLLCKRVGGIEQLAHQLRHLKHQIETHKFGLNTRAFTVEKRDSLSQAKLH